MAKSRCGWNECRSCSGRPEPEKAGEVASEAARDAVMYWPHWGMLSCDGRRTLALAFDEFKEKVS